MCIRLADKIHSCRKLLLKAVGIFLQGPRGYGYAQARDDLVHKSRSSDVAQIARALSTLDQDTASKLKRKFEIAYLICKEGLAFTKMSALCEYEEKHDLGAGYKNNRACAVFVDYIAQAQREALGLYMYAEWLNHLIKDVRLISTNVRSIS